MWSVNVPADQPWHRIVGHQRREGRNPVVIMPIVVRGDDAIGDEDSKEEGEAHGIKEEKGLRGGFAREELVGS